MKVDRREGEEGGGREGEREAGVRQDAGPATNERRIGSSGATGVGEDGGWKGAARPRERLLHSTCRCPVGGKYY